jgi:hypothetical protein
MFEWCLQCFLRIVDVGKSLNLSMHWVGFPHDERSVPCDVHAKRGGSEVEEHESRNNMLCTTCPVDIEGHLAGDGRFYVCDFARWSLVCATVSSLEKQVWESSH